MKIVIAGAGAVGTHLAKLLSNEAQDIVLIDESIEKLIRLDSYDLRTVCVSPTSIAGLKEAETAKADLFIAVTPEETTNMTCCMIASELGAKKTVARIDNYEYLSPKHAEMFNKLGVNSLIYPELLASREIIDGIRMSWARQWWEVHNGALILIAVKLRQTAEIFDIPLRILCDPTVPYHIVAIKRDGETIIPSGDDELKLYDVAYFMTTKKYVPYVRKVVGKEHYADVRNVMIMGGGRTAMRTAQAVPDYMHVKIVEQDEARCERLNALLNRKEVMIINGDGRDTALLRDEGLERTEAFVAVTGNTETNILACLTAKRNGVRKTVAMVDNLDYVSMAENLDIGTIINKKTIAASHIYQMMLEADVSNVKCLTVASADVAEFVVKNDARVTKKMVKDLDFPKNVTIGGLVRNGEGQLVQGDTQIHAGDTVVVFCMQMMIKKIEKYFI